jgi:hypothetical protein
MAVLTSWHVLCWTLEPASWVRSLGGNTFGGGNRPAPTQRRAQRRCKTVNVLGNMVNSASHTSGGGTGSIRAGQTTHGNSERRQRRGVFGNLNISNVAAAGTHG